MPRNSSKPHNAILYFLHHANNEHLGKLKLMKLLYYLDFDHFEKCGESVTGDAYRKLDYGPAPINGDVVLTDMQQKGLLRIEKVRMGDGEQYRYTPLAEFNACAFSTTEMEVLADVARKGEHHSRSEIVSATHGEAPWRAARMGDLIPYELAYYRKKFAVEGLEDEEPTRASASV
ncbi:MAG: type II toxin-antitoxin system antitoxin SocA domain-containing protein [Chloroflexota bacterium]